MQASERAELIRQYEDGVPTFTKALAGVPAGALKWRPAPGESAGQRSQRARYFSSLHLIRETDFVNRIRLVGGV